MPLALTPILAAVLLVGIALTGGIVYATSPGPSSLSLTSTATNTVTSSINATSASSSSGAVTGSVNSTGDTTTVTSIVTATATNTTTSYTSTQFLTPSSGDVAQSCAAFGDADQTVSCTLPNPVTSGHLLLVDIAEVPESYIVGLQVPTITETQVSNSTVPTETQTSSSLHSLIANLSDSLGDNFRLIGNASQPGSTYILYVFVANITQSDTDQVTLSGVGNYPFLLVHELQNVTRVVGFSTGIGNSTSPAVSPYTAAPGSFVFGAVFIHNNLGVISANVTAGPGNTLLDITYGIAEEYNTTGGSTITSPFMMTNVLGWGEVSVAFR